MQIWNSEDLLETMIAIHPTPLVSESTGHHSTLGGEEEQPGFALGMLKVSLSTPTCHEFASL